MITPRRLLASALATLLLPSSFLFAQHAAPTVRITAPIDASQLVTIKGSVHPLANARNDRGPASPGTQLDRLHLILKRGPDQETALRQLIQEQNTPGSPSYHKWLTPAQFAAQFGPSAQDISTVENWLSSQGFTVNKLEPGNQALDISGTVGQLQSAFHTQIHRYMVNGQLHYANANNPSVPAALAPVIGGFASLNNFQYHSYAKKLGEATYDPSTGQAKASWTIGGSNGNNYVLSPADFAVQYDLNPVYSTLGLKGDGQTIAIVNESNININLVNQFRSLFGLPANPPQVIIDGNDPGVDGINNPDGPNYASVEAYLDVEWAGAVAPNATIDLVIAADTSLESGLSLAAEHAVYSDVAPIVSISFGNCELSLGSQNAFWNDLWEQAAAQGQTVIVSSGDNGSAGCDDGTEYASNGLAVNGLASTPYDVAVGGTDFYYSGGASQLATYWNTTASNSTPTVSIKGYIPEQPWNSSQYGLNLFNEYTSDGSTNISAGSGGASSAALCSGNSYSPSTGMCTGTTSGYAKPAWQSGIAGIPADSVRDLPDVSLFAANGFNDSYYPICATDGDCQPATAGGTVQIFGVGGTSAAAPSFAGIMALVDEKYGPQGQADTILYPLKADSSAAFHDVTSGTNSVPCAYSATPGSNSPDCIAVANPITVTLYDSSGDETGTQVEGQIGSGTTAYYNAAAGYNLATGLGSIDADQLISNWGSVKPGASSTILAAAPTTITVGSSGNDTIAVSGTVTGTSPTGNVTIVTDNTAPNEQSQAAFALNGSGQFSGTLSNLPGGQYNIWASYGGDAKNAASSSSKTLITVNQGASAVAFNIFENGLGTSFNANQSSQIDYGTQLMLGAEAGPQADLSALQSCIATLFQGGVCAPWNFPRATGTVTFKDGSTALNTAVINSEGDAEYNAPFSVGSHVVSATYNGDGSYSTSTSSTISFTVAKDTPSVFVAASNQVSSSSGFEVVGGANQPTVLNIIIENSAQYNANSNSANAEQIYPVPVAPPTGTISISGLPSGVPTSAPLSAGVDPTDGAQAGVATITIPATTSQTTYNLTIGYSGDNNYTSNVNCGNGSVTSCGGSIALVTGSGITTQTTATMSGNISPNSTLTITGSVTATSGSTAPTGDVYLFSSGNYLTSATLKTGSAVRAESNRKASLWSSAGGAVVAAALFFWIPRRRRGWLAMLVMLAVLVSLSGMACGGGGSNAGSGGSGGTGGGGGSTGSGGTASFTFVLNSQTLVQGANFLTVQYAGTNSTPIFLPSAFNLTTQVPNPLSDFSLVPTTQMLQVGINGSTTETINVTSVNGFSGSVSLSCSAPGAVTCSVTQPASLSAGSTTNASLTITASSGTAAGNYPVEVSGEYSSGEYIHTLAIAAAVR